GTIQHWHITSGKVLHVSTESNNQIYCCDYRVDGRFFATAGKDACVRVYDEQTKTLVQTMSGGNNRSTSGHSSRIFALKWHPYDQNILLSGGWDNTIQV